VERDTGPGPSTLCLERGTVPELHFLPFLNLTSGRNLPLFRNSDNRFFDLSPLA